MIEGKELTVSVLNLDANDKWDALINLASPHLDLDGAKILQDIFGNNTATVIVERQYIDKDYRNTFSSFHSQRFITPDSRCIRLHFFGTSVDFEKLADAADDEDKKKALEYLGYSIVRPIRPNCIGRTLATPGTELKGCYLCCCTERVSLLGTRLDIRGFPFITQDTDATVCAESSLWMLLRYFSNRYSKYREFYPSQITELTQDYSLGRIFPSGGLYTWQMSEALRRAGFQPMIYEKENFKNDFLYLLYSYIESGFPLLVTFKEHVVVAFGHPANKPPITNANDMENKNCYSSAFNTGFIINDDDGLPYQLLSNKGSDNNGNQSGHSLEDIESFIVPLPNKVFLTADAFKTIVENTVVKGSMYGIQKRSEILSRSSTIFRVYLTSCRAFKEKISSRGMGNINVAIVYRQMPMPHFIWVCEFSTPDRYSKEVYGEILWDATRNADEPDGMLAIHYPEYFAWFTGKDKQPYQGFDLTESKPYDNFIHNLIPVE